MFRRGLFTYLFIISILFLPSVLLADGLTLGTAVPQTLDTLCPTGYNCQTFSVTNCYDPAPASAHIAVKQATNPRGLVIFTTGQCGGGWWTDALPDLYDFAEELIANGITIVQLKWTTCWYGASSGTDLGIARAACRPATMIQYIFDNFYVPLGIQAPAVGTCGFCATGNSGGSNQVTYPLAYYGLEDIIDVSIPTGGPTFAAMTKSCMRNQSESVYWYDSQGRKDIDNVYGDYSGNGPCYNSDASFLSSWFFDSCATGGFDYFHPNTRIHFLLGAIDTRNQARASDYFNRLQQENTPYLKWETIPNTPHLVVSTEQGQEALKKAILDADGDGSLDTIDNCPHIQNSDQLDTDSDGLGDACDSCTLPLDDPDQDGICASVDNCPDAPNPDQLDFDGDGLGDICDPCPDQFPNTCGGDADADGFPDPSDNCPSIYNPAQEDFDQDGTGNVCDSTPFVSATINDVSIDEGISGTSFLTFTVTLSNASSADVTFDYSTQAGTATANTDYVQSSGTLGISAGNTSGQITVVVNGDQKYENGEVFFVNLTNPTNVTIADNQGKGSIISARPLVTIGNLSQYEGSAGTVQFTFPVTLSFSYTNSGISLNYVTSNGTALAGEDYTALPLTKLTIPANTSSAVITISVNGDTNIESDETFQLKVSKPFKCLLANTAATATILNDD